MGAERCTRKFMNGTVGSDNDAKHGDVADGGAMAHDQTSATRLWYVMRTLVLISEAGSGDGGAYRTEGNGRHSRATRQSSRRATLVPRALRRQWFCSQSCRQVPLVLLRG